MSENVKTRHMCYAYFGCPEKVDWMPSDAVSFRTKGEAFEYVTNVLEVVSGAKEDIKFIVKPMGSAGSQDPLAQIGSVGVKWDTVVPLEESEHSRHNIIFRIKSKKGEPKGMMVISRVWAFPPMGSDKYELA